MSFNEDHARKYAARFRAERGPDAEPTDKALAEAFAPCVRPAKADEYPAIREALAKWGES